MYYEKTNTKKERRKKKPQKPQKRVNEFLTM